MGRTHTAVRKIVVQPKFSHCIVLGYLCICRFGCIASAGDDEREDYESECNYQQNFKVKHKDPDCFGPVTKFYHVKSLSF